MIRASASFLTHWIWDPEIVWRALLSYTGRYPIETPGSLIIGVTWNGKVSIGRAPSGIPVSLGFWTEGGTDPIELRDGLKAELKRHFKMFPVAGTLKAWLPEWWSVKVTA
jgi:hypothetical protein